VEPYSKKDLILNLKNFYENLVNLDNMPMRISGPKTLKNNQDRFTVVNSNGSSNYIDLFLKNNGLTTVFISGADISEDLKFHVDNCIKNSIISYASSFELVVPDFAMDKFNLLIDFLKEFNYSIHLSEEAFFYEYNVSQKNENIIIKYYKTKSKLHCQGRPNNIFYNLSEFIVEFFPEITFYDNRKGKIQIDVDKNKLNSELISFYPSLSKCKSDVVLRLVQTSYALMKLNIDLPDYSFQVINLLRAIEGILKKALSENGISLTKKEGFKNIFSFDTSQGRHLMNPNDLNRYPIEIKSKLESMYSFYSKYRHPIVHTGTDINSTLMLTKSDAEKIFDMGITHISEYLKLKYD